MQPDAGVSSSGLRRRTGWAVADQALSSATNVAITVLAARSLDPSHFGAFGIAYAVYVLAIGIARGFVTEPLLSRPTAIDGSWPKTCSAVTGAVFPIGAAIAVVVASLMAFASRDFRSAGFTLAVMMPGLLVQDAWRYCFMAQGRPVSALINDAVWAIAQAVIVVPFAVAHRLDLATLALAWGGAASVAAVAGSMQARARPRLRAGHLWFRSHVDLGWRYTAEFLVANGAAQLAIFGLGGIAGLAAVGAVRAVQTLFGPINIVYSGIYLVLVPAGARLARKPIELRRTMFRASLALCAFSAVWTLGALLIPTRVGEALFGRSWHAADRLVLYTGALLVAGGLAAGGIAGLRSLAAARESLRARMLTLPLMLLAPLFGALVADARGYTLGLATATAVGGGLFWLTFRRQIVRVLEPAEVNA